MPKALEPDRAQPPRAPTRSGAVLEQERSRAAYLRTREQLERSSVVRGLVLLAVVALLVGVLYAGWDRSFPPGWWRRW